MGLISIFKSRNQKFRRFQQLFCKIDFENQIKCDFEKEIGPIMLRLAHTRVPLLIKRIWSKSESGTNSLLLPWFYAPAVSRSHSWLRSDFFLSFLSKKDIQFRCVLVRTLKILHVLVFRVWKRLSYRSKAGFMYQTSFYKIRKQ